MIPRQKIELLVLGGISTCLMFAGFELLKLGMSKAEVTMALTGLFAFISGLLTTLGIVGYIRQKHKVEAEEPCDLE